MWANAVDPKGRIYAVPERDAYRINIYSADGVLEQVVEREYQSWPRTKAELDWFTALFQGSFRNMPFEVDLDLADTAWDINWLSRGLQVDATASMFGGAGEEFEDSDAEPMELVCYRKVI